MGFKETAQDAGWSVRWTIREAAWDVEERLLWRGTDAARATTEKAAKGAEPLQRLIQTRLAWPVADAWRDGSTAMRIGMATAAVAAVAATSAVASSAIVPDAPGSAAPQVASADAPTLVATAGDQTLQGVAPDFVSNDGGPTTTAAAKAVDPAAPPKEVQPPPADAPPEQVAAAFAEAFVQYEVGEVNDGTTATFEAVAEKPLFQSLAEDPPRLPAGTEVPKAEVKNVVLSEREGKQVEASISLVRLEAASELRLTLQDTPDGWQVVGVRG